MQEDQWFTLFGASSALWIVQHDVHADFLLFLGGIFVASQAPQVGGSRMASTQQSEGGDRLRVAPIGVECSREKPASSVGQRTSGRVGRTWTTSELTSRFREGIFLARQGAGPLRQLSSIFLKKIRSIHLDVGSRIVTFVPESGDKSQSSHREAERQQHSETEALHATQQRATWRYRPP